MNVGFTGSASATIGLMLSGMSTANTPPKNSHARSQPSITVASVCWKDNQTNMCRDTTAVKINAWTARRRPAGGSHISPSRPRSSWHSTPAVEHEDEESAWWMQYGATGPRCTPGGSPRPLAADDAAALTRRRASSHQIWARRQS